MATFIAIFFGILSAVLTSTKHIFIRKYKNQLGYEGSMQAIDSNIFEYGVTCLLLFPLSKIYDYTFKDLLIGTAAGFFFAAARVLIAVGVADGMAGPSYGMMSTHSIHQTIWTTVIAGQ